MKKFNVTGMSCAACSSRVEKAVGGLEKVDNCSVNLLTGTMLIEGSATEEEIIAAVEKAGYGASSAEKKSVRKQEERALRDSETPRIVKRLITSAILLAVLMYISMGSMMLGAPIPSFLANDPMAQALLQLILSASIMVINQKFFVSGFTSIARLSPNMDSLVTLGSSASFIYSVVRVFGMSASYTVGDIDAAHAALHDLYFESAAMILVLITVGKMLEARSKGKTTEAIEGLIRLSPKTAKIVRDGAEVEVSIDEVKVSDIFAVYPGESIPVDGIVVDGSSAVDESALTGESIPTDKAEGDKVSAGTVNQSGYIRCRATGVGEDTLLSQIIKTVSDAAATKAPIAKLADRVSGFFVPVVIGISLCVLAVWLILGRDIGFSLERAISVLVISCPCALGLATPVAIMVGSGVGAKNGILFKTAAAIEETGRARTVVLDKTGTVTSGKPAVTDIIPGDGYDGSALIKLAVSLEQKSEHPLAFAVVERAKEMNISPEEVTDFSAVTGSGLLAKLGGEEISGGNLKYIESKVVVPEKIGAEYERLTGEGKTPLFFAVGDALAGIIAVADTVREDSAKAIKDLKDMGMHVVMLTGDNGRTANAVGEAVGVDEVIAEVLPHEKAEAVTRLSSLGKTIMVGDGINDAPALTAADVGVAIGAGTDIAIDAADAVLMKSDLSSLTAAVCLSRATLRNIRQNLFWAFIYNFIGIPLAAGAFISLGIRLTPMFGALAMSLSSFCVVTNALRLNFVKLEKNKKKINETEKNKMEKIFKVEGMMCGHCEAHVKKALEALSGVESAVASHEKGTVVIKLSGDVSDSLIKKTIEDEGYKVV